jgi:hypothetical protein
MDVLSFKKEPKKFAPAGIWQEFYGEKSRETQAAPLRTSLPGFVGFCRAKSHR